VSAILKWLLGLDAGELAAADSWRFDFVGQYGPFVRLLLVLAVGALVFLAVRRYRREGDAPRRAKVVLTCLRATVLTMLLLVLLRPAVVLRTVKQLRSIVVVAVDESLSMSFEDRALGGPQAEALAVAAGVSTSEVAEMSRQDLVRAILGRSDGVLARLAEDHPLLIVGFSGDRSTHEPFSRVIAAVGGSDEAAADTPPDLPTPAEMLGPLQATGFGTDVARAIRDGLDRTRGRRLAAVIVVSDGQITTPGGDGRLLAAVDLANERAVPVYTVLAGDPTPRKNISVVGLDGPARTPRNSTIELTALLATRNMSEESIQVELLHRAVGEPEWPKTGLTQSVEIPPAQDVDGAPDQADIRTVEVAFQFEPADLGELEFKARVAPRADEQDLDDNTSRPLRVTVSDEKIHVLLVGSGAGWEFQYLRNTLIRAPEAYRVSVWQQNADEEINQAASTGMKLARLPKDLTQLIGTPGEADKPGYQVVVLIDPRPTADGFDRAFVEMLQTYVSDHGGGLCYVAGKKHTDDLLLDNESFKPLGALLPVTLSPNTVDLAERLGSRRPQPWPIELTGYGRDHQIMRMGGSGSESGDVWGFLPGIYWSHPVGRLKTGARALAEHGNPMRRTARNRPEPVLAVQSPGTGRVAYVGFDSTWRWRLLRDGHYHRRFWSNLIRHLAGGKAGHRVTISAGGERFAAGEPIPVEVLAYDEAFAPLEADQFEVELIDTEGQFSRTIALPAVAGDGQRGHFKGQIDEAITARRGTYRLTAMQDHPHAAQIVAERLIVIELPQAEALNKEANETPLRAIGRRSIAQRPVDGLTRLSDIDALAEWIPSGRRRSVREWPRELWDSRLMLLAVVGLLAAEWILRKKHNMI